MRQGNTILHMNQDKRVEQQKCPDSNSNIDMSMTHHNQTKELITWFLIRPQDPSDQPKAKSLSDTTPPTQELDQDNEEDKDGHENKVEHNDQVQEESNDQWGDEDDGDKDEGNSEPTPPHVRVCHNVQRDHLVNNILGNIKKGISTRSRVAFFCKYYSFVSSFELFKVEDALCDLDWVVAMQ
jgi:hypothetical protein